jgi:hypothetical protein
VAVDRATHNDTLALRDQVVDDQLEIKELGV